LIAEGRKTLGTDSFQKREAKRLEPVFRKKKASPRSFVVWREARESLVPEKKGCGFEVGGGWKVSVSLRRKKQRRGHRVRRGRKGRRNAKTGEKDGALRVERGRKSKTGGCATTKHRVQSRNMKKKKAITEPSLRSRGKLLYPNIIV